MADLLAAEEEAIRDAVDALPADVKVTYYEMANEELKDPDLYATLAYAFFSGLHHFYLGRWGRGLVDLGLNVVGIGLIIVGAMQDSLPPTVIGVLLVLGVAIVELKDLFQSQKIVRQYNLERQLELLKALRGRLKGP